jgi:two-component system KDP operon response regulator KdpE
MNAPVVLVIDDEPQIRRVVRNAVEPGMGAVLEAGTGREGIDMAAAERPQLVVLDLGLPDMDGVAVCREIRSWSSAPIIVLSARRSPQVESPGFPHWRRRRSLRDGQTQIGKPTR